jgi:hypothetical protein
MAHTTADLVIIWAKERPVGGFLEFIGGAAAAWEFVRSFGPRRLAAFLFDVALLSVVRWLWESASLPLAVDGIEYVGFFSYRVATLAVFGATGGKLALDLRVISPKGKVSFRQAAQREVQYLLLFPLFALLVGFDHVIGPLNALVAMGLVMLGFLVDAVVVTDSNGYQAMHDLFADTAVVRRGEDWSVVAARASPTDEIVVVGTVLAWLNRLRHPTRRRDQSPADEWPP